MSGYCRQLLCRAIGVSLSVLSLSYLGCEESGGGGSSSQPRATDQSDVTGEDTGFVLDTGTETDNGSNTDIDAGTGMGADGDSGTAEQSDNEIDSEVCGETNFEVEFNKIEMLVVLDRSQSMWENGIWVPMGKALWSVTHDFQTLINFGLILFPGEECSVDDFGQQESACVSPSKPSVAFQQEDAIEKIGTVFKSKANGGTPPCGGTPTAETLSVVDNYFKGLNDSGKRYVLLATDGAPNCNPELTYPPCTCVADNCDDQPLNCLDDVKTNEAAAALYDGGKGYPVYVLGMGGANSWADQLDAIAKAGGTETYNAVDDTSKITEALEKITSEVVTCEFEVDWENLSEDVDQKRKDLVNFYCKVKADDALSDKNIVGFDDGCASNKGWTWQDESTVKFCEESCNKLKKQDCTRVAATFGCKSYRIY